MKIVSWSLSYELAAGWAAMMIAALGIRATGYGRYELRPLRATTRASMLLHVFLQN